MPINTGPRGTNRRPKCNDSTLWGGYCNFMSTRPRFELGQLVIVATSVYDTVTIQIIRIFTLLILCSTICRPDKPSKYTLHKKNAWIQ